VAADADERLAAAETELLAASAATRVPQHHCSYLQTNRHTLGTWYNGLSSVLTPVLRPNLTP